MWENTRPTVCIPKYSSLFLKSNETTLVSAHDSSKPYYDPKSKPEDPKWSVVHVEFRQKLETPITLKEMKDWYGEKDHPLAGMQMLRMTRMSVTRVSAGEWEFLVGQMRERGDEVK